MGLCIRMAVCPMGLIDAFTWEAWTLYNALANGANQWPWPGGYYGQPAVYHRAVKVIEAELNQIKREAEAEARVRNGKV